MIAVAEMAATARLRRKAITTMRRISGDFHLLIEFHIRTVYRYCKCCTRVRRYGRHRSPWFPGATVIHSCTVSPDPKDLSLPPLRTNVSICDSDLDLGFKLAWLMLDFLQSPFHTRHSSLFARRSSRLRDRETSPLVCLFV